MKLTQAILPVAGLGTRFLPWTKAVPKELLPIGNQPIIALLVDECLSVGITDICFVINRGKEAIPQYFYENPALNAELERKGKTHLLEELSRYDSVNFHVTYQEQMLGDGHALLQARSWVKTPEIAVLFGDDLIMGKENGLQQLTKAMTKAKTDRDAVMLCLQKIDPKLTEKYGIAAVEETKGNIKRVTGLVEKPKPKDAPSDLGIVGKYIVPKMIFDKLHLIEEGSHGGEIRLIDALIANKDSLNIFGCVFAGKRYDTGTPEGYKEAVLDLG
jgi:UTP--glucose-1-phosphate uridylyltransferase